VLLLMGPGTIGMAATQINLVVNNQLATGQGTGAVSWLNYAFRLMYLPIGLFGVSIATATLPTVSRHVTQKDLAAVRDTIARGISLMLMLNVPATIGLIVLAAPIVELLFERGQFLPADTAATAAAVRLYAIGLVGYSTVRIASPTFYAIGDSRTPAIVSALVILVNVLVSIALVHAMGFAGLALATSIAAVANAAILVWLLRGRLDGLDGRRLLMTLAKVTLAAGVMAVTTVAIQHAMDRVAPGAHLSMRLLRLMASIGGGIAALAGVAKILGVEEFDDAAALVLGRVRKLLDKR